MFEKIKEKVLEKCMKVMLEIEFLEMLNNM